MIPKSLPLVLCAAALAGGLVALLVWGLAPPTWLAALEAALLVGAALGYGFTAYLPELPRWLWLRPIRGTVLVTLGIAALYVPPQLVLSAYLVGVGLRLVWQAACDLAEKALPPETGAAPGTSLARVAPGGLRRRDDAGDLVVEERRW